MLTSKINATIRDMIDEDKKESTLSIEGNIIHFDVVGVIDEEKAKRLHHVGVKALDSGTVEFVLINMSGTHRFSSAARKHLVVFLQNKKVLRTAIVGGNIFMKTVASFVMSAAQVDNVKFFETEELALAWLK